MSTMTPCPANDPRMIAWTKYKATEEYANVLNWAHHEEHTEGSLWAAFIEGFAVAQPLATLGAASGAQRISGDLLRETNIGLGYPLSAPADPSGFQEAWDFFADALNQRLALHSDAGPAGKAGS